MMNGIPFERVLSSFDALAWGVSYSVATEMEMERNFIRMSYKIVWAYFKGIRYA